MNPEALALVFTLLLTLRASVSAQDDPAQSTVDEIHQIIQEQFSLLQLLNPTCDAGPGEDFVSYLMIKDNNLDVEIDPDKIPLQFQNANKNCIYVVLGGFLETSNCTATRTVIQEVLNKGCTVIFPDWQRAAGPGCYKLADPNNLVETFKCYVDEVTLVKWVGEKIADLLLRISKETGIEPKAITILSFSLGGQVSGQVGRAFQQGHPTNAKIGKMIVFDPAGPLFSLPVLSPACALLHVRSGDADCVIFLDSNAGAFGTTNFEASDKSLVINGGTIQSDCFPVLGKRGAVAYILCNHGFSGRVWMDIFTGTRQVNVKCVSVVGGLLNLFYCLQSEILFSLDCQDKRQRGVFANRVEIKNASRYDEVKYDLC